MSPINKTKVMRVERGNAYEYRLKSYAAKTVEISTASTPHSDFAGCVRSHVGELNSKALRATAINRLKVVGVGETEEQNNG